MHSLFVLDKPVYCKLYYLFYQTENKMLTEAMAKIIPTLKESLKYVAPTTIYCKSKEEFDKEIGCDFIRNVNQVTQNNEEFLVGLSHGKSPAGAYAYILAHYDEILHPERIHYTCINSKLKRQRGLVDVMDAISFLKALIETNKINKDQILGRSLDRENIEAYKDGLNTSLTEYLNKLHKKGLDYVFVASTTKGQVAGITKNSTAFNSNDLVVVVKDTEEPELTYTPDFLKKSVRIAFLATKAEKRMPLAWLYYKWGKENESPSFLRFIDDVKNRMMVFIDDQALTWPQVKLKRESKFGDTHITIDMALPFDEKKKKKLPVIIMVHGFLGLNTFDALLAFNPSDKYISAAMHYGSIPHALPPKKYSEFVTENINHTVGYFGELGHPVYIFDHSMANTYLLMISENIEKYDAVKTYLKGRIACNPFFGFETKHATARFVDSVILKSNISVVDKSLFRALRTMRPFETKQGMRYLAIGLTHWLIKSDSTVHNRIWKAIKQRIMVLVADMDMLPELNKIPIEHTLNKLPIKIFAIQIQSALRESKELDKIKMLTGFENNNIPTLVLKSAIDPIAKFVPHLYETSKNTTIIDVTNTDEKEIFKEHLFYMIHPKTTIDLINQFIKETEH